MGGENVPLMNRFYLGLKQLLMSSEFWTRATPFNLVVCRQLEHANHPLISVQDVEEQNLGMKTTQKVIEILNTGRLMRNEELSKDEKHIVTAELLKIWGAGEACVETWYQSGKRSPSALMNTSLSVLFTITVRQKL